MNLYKSITRLIVVLFVGLFAKTLFGTGIALNATLIDPSYLITSLDDKDREKQIKSVTVDGEVYSVDGYIEHPDNISVRLLHLSRPVLSRDSITRAYVSVQEMELRNLANDPLLCNAYFGISSYIDGRYIEFNDNMVKFPRKIRGFCAERDLEKYTFLFDQWSGKAHYVPPVLLDAGAGYYLSDQDNNERLLGIKLGLKKESFNLPFPLILHLDSKMNAWINRTILQISLGQVPRGYIQYEVKEDWGKQGAISRETASIAKHVPYHFVVWPYQQPGNAPNLDYEERVIVWQTAFNDPNVSIRYYNEAEVGLSEEPCADSNIISSYEITPGQYLYKAVLKNLDFDSEYSYEILSNQKQIFSGSFQTRTQGSKLSFAVFGDTYNFFEHKLPSHYRNAGLMPERVITYMINDCKPNFIVHTGDFCYMDGLIDDYIARAFPTANNLIPSLYTGAPLMRNTPIYLAPGNHDTDGTFDFDKFNNGGCGMMHYFDLPLNGPLLEECLYPEVMAESEEGINRFNGFKRCVGFKYPRMLNYSFDWGNAHFVVLETGTQFDPFYAEEGKETLADWITKDLQKSKAKWKFVVGHRPPFTSSKGEVQQLLRVLHNVFESNAVDMVFSGHDHNYQITHPLIYESELDENGAPRYDATAEMSIIRVSGRAYVEMPHEKSTLEKTYYKRPNGIIYVISGAGGGDLYHINKLQDYTRKAISEYSFTTVNIDNDQLELKQIAGEGKVLDHVVIDKS